MYYAGLGVRHQETISAKAAVSKPATRAANVRLPLLTYFSRLADLDEKLRGILDQLARSNRPEASAVGEDLVNSLASYDGSPTTGNSNAPSVDELNATSTSVRLDIEDSSAGAMGPDQFHAISNETLPGQTELTLPMLDYLLSQFRENQAHFPFVVICAHWTASKMLKDRPFLFLAAITSVTGRYPALQEALAEELKETLSRRVVSIGKHDLDLLQGLLVHLAW